MLLTVVLADVVSTICPVVLVESDCVVVYADSSTPIDFSVMNKI